MAKPEQIIEQWGADSLVRVPDVLLATVDLPLGAKEFLGQVGVPKQVPIFGGAVYEALPVSPPLEFQKTERLILQRLADTPFLCLACITPEVPEDFVCIQEKAGTIGFNNEGSSFLFINSNLQSWLECLVLYKSFISGDKDITPKALHRFELSLKSIDPDAFDDAESYYWPLAVENFAAGF